MASASQRDDPPHNRAHDFDSKNGNKPHIHSVNICRCLIRYFSRTRPTNLSVLADRLVDDKRALAEEYRQSIHGDQQRSEAEAEHGSMILLAIGNLRVDE